MSYRNVPLGEVAEFINGMAFKPSDWEPTGRKIIRIQNLSDPSKPFNCTNKNVDPKYLIPPGTLLVSWSATLDVFEWNQPHEAVLNQHIFKVVPFVDKIHLPYLKLVLKTAIRSMIKHTHGSTMKHINRREFLETLIPLPDLPEQKRIAAILDKADDIRRKRKRAIELTDSFLRAVFLEMFGDPVANTKGWHELTLGELVDFKTGKLDSNAAVPDGKYPFFTCARETYWIDTFAFDCKALLLAGNNADGKYSVKLYEGKFNAYQRTYVMTLKRSELNYEYLKYVIESKLAFLRHHSKGTNTKYLTLALLQSIKIQVPDRSLQDQFVRLFDKISNQLGERFQQSSILLDRLASSLHFHVLDQSPSHKPQQFATKEEAYAV